MMGMRMRAGTCIETVLVSMLALVLACDDDPASPLVGESTDIAFFDLQSIDAEDGVFEVWVHDGRDTISVGRIPSGAGPIAPMRFEMPINGVRGVLVTIEPSGDVDAQPSRSVLMHGSFDGGTARLTIEGAITDGRPLEPEPGAHSLFTTSNNVELGYPSFENAGMWLFTVAPSRNRHKTREVKLTPLRSSWVYEGWIVHQVEPRVWISYGKYRPDELSLLTSRDDSGAGPFSGDEDYRNAGVEDVPGEEWTTTRIASRIGIELPAALAPPLALDAVDASGNALWHHVITVEPAFDESEGPLEGRPFVVRPYENSIGAGGPGEPRFIELAHPLPTAEVRRASGS
jgi:hypothetical protein